MKQLPIISMLLAYADKLKFKNLFLVTLTLFIIDFLVPDMIPMIDEIILGLLAIVLANWKKDRALDIQGEIIEGEIVDEENNTN
jgi:hypothetical protein